MSPPLVTVIIPAYRHERYVGVAIESVLAQTVADWELIVIDDCSPDGTWAQIQRHRDPRITALRHDANRGAHATLNEGLSLARGRYVAILNSDDVYAPGRLERTIAHLESTGADLVGTGVRLVDDAGAPIEDAAHPWKEWYAGRLEVLRASGDLVAALLDGNVFVTTSNFVLRRELVDRVGGFEERRYAHDYAFLMAAASAGESAIALLQDEQLLSYRWHDANTIRENAWRIAREEFDVVCQYLPLMLPQEDRRRIEGAMRHLSALSPICPEADASAVVRLDKELRRLSGYVEWLEKQRTVLQDYARRLEGEAAKLHEELARLQVDRDGLEQAVIGLRASYSYRLGSALLAPAKRARALLGIRR
jgi:glycosyltransferase involved in cell wall biosynthesis